MFRNDSVFEWIHVMHVIFVVIIIKFVPRRFNYVQMFGVWSVVVVVTAVVISVVDCHSLVPSKFSFV